MPKATITANRSEGYKLAISGATGLTTLKLHEDSGPVLAYASTSATAPDLVTGDDGAIPLSAGQGWSGRTLAEVFPDLPGATHVHIRNVSREAKLAVRYA